MSLVPCSACHRHVDAAETECPFCGTHLSARAAQPLVQKIVSRETVAVAVGIGLALTACACYGPPPQARPEPPSQPTATTTATPGSPGYAEPPPEERAH